MLYIDGEESTRLQNILFTIYFQCKDIREAINQYFICTELEDDRIIEKFNEFPSLFSTILDSMRYRIVIGMGNIFDNNQKSLSIWKLLNLCEQEGKEKLNKEVKKVRDELYDYEDFIENINTLRDKMYGHIEIKYSLETEDIYDKDFEFLNKQVLFSKKILNYIMEECVKFSKEYDDDKLKLEIHWNFDKGK